MFLEKDRGIPVATYIYWGSASQFEDNLRIRRPPTERGALPPTRLCFVEPAFRAHRCPSDVCLVERPYLSLLPWSWTPRKQTMNMLLKVFDLTTLS